MEVFELSNWNQHTLIFHFMKRKIFQYNKTRAYIFQVCADSWPYWHKVYLCLFNKEPFLSHMLIHNLKLIPTSQTIKPVSPKGNSVLNIHGKDWWWSWNSILWPPDAKSWLIWKDLDAGEDWGQEKKGVTEDEMIGWHHRLNGHEFEQTPGDSEGQGGLVSCSPWGRKESDTTEWSNSKSTVLRIKWTE